MVEYQEGLGGVGTLTGCGIVVTAAAVGLAFPVTYLLHTFGGALGSACTSTCSRLIGSGRQDEVPNLLLHVIGLSAVLSVVLIAIGLVLLHLEPTLNSPDTDPTVREMALEYGIIYFLGGFFSLFAMSVNALFRGEGDTAFPFKVMAVGLVLNIVLDPLFIFGPGPFPCAGQIAAPRHRAHAFSATPGRGFYHHRQADLINFFYRIFFVGDHLASGYHRYSSLDHCFARRDLIAHGIDGMG